MMLSHLNVSRQSQVAIKTCWQSEIWGGGDGGVYNKTITFCLADFSNYTFLQQ